MQRKQPAAPRNEVHQRLCLGFGWHEVACVEHHCRKPREIADAAEIVRAAHADTFILGHEVQQHEAGQIEIVVLAAGDEMDADRLAHAADSRGMR